MHRLRPHLSGLLAMAVLGCAGTPPTTGGTPRPAPTRAAGGGPAPAVVTGGPGSPAPGPTAPAGLAPPLVAPPAPGRAALVGVVRLPASILSNNGGAIISDNGGGVLSNNGGNYRLLALDERPAAGVEVALVQAGGEPVLDAAGRPIAARTDAEGAYSLPYAGGETNLAVQVALPGDKGRALAFVPRGAREADLRVDVDTASTLALGYVLERYVRGRQAVLERLPADIEAETRALVAGALAAAPAPPVALTEEVVVREVDRLRDADDAVDAQLEKVRKILLAGLSNQGIGKFATDLEVNVGTLAVSPAGEILFADPTTSRVYKKDADGKLAVVAGTGSFVLGRPAPDGLPGPEASVLCSAIAFGPAGELYVADMVDPRIMVLGADGRMTTFTRLPAAAEIRDLDVGPAGELRIATREGLWRAAKGDAHAALIAGGPPAGASLADAPPVDPTARANAAMRFNGISGIGSDPRTGDVLVCDFPGVIWRVGPATSTHVAGRDGGAELFAGDGGPPADASLCPGGDVAVDDRGRIYVADALNNRVRRIADGRIETIAGTGEPGSSGDGGPALQARMRGLTDIRVLPDGGLLVAADGEVRLIADDGTVSTPIGSSGLRLGKRPAREVQLLRPVSLVYDPDADAMIIADDEHLWRWTLADDEMAILASRGVTGEAYRPGASATALALEAFSGLVREPDGALLYFAGVPDFSIKCFRQVGDVVTALAGGLGSVDAGEEPLADEAFIESGAAVVRIDDTYYYTLRREGLVRTFTPGGRTAPYAGGGERPPAGVPLREARLDLITSMVAGPAPERDLYVGTTAGLVRLERATGMVRAVPGVQTVDALAWGPDGKLYVAEGTLGRVLRLEPPRRYVVAGRGGPNLVGSRVDDSLAYPSAMAFDARGDLYVADRQHQQIKVVPAARLQGLSPVEAP